MTLRRHILVLLVALFGLLAPSFAAGFSAVTASTTSVVVAACDDGVELPEYKPCREQGGKRVLPCHPDLGILVAGAEAPAWGRSARRGLTADPLRRTLVPAADPPPPRRG